MPLEDNAVSYDPSDIENGERTRHIAYIIFHRKWPAYSKLQFFSRVSIENSTAAP